MGSVQEVSVGPPGGVVLGEQGQAAFAIVNDGALEVQFQIRSDAQVSGHHTLLALCPQTFHCILPWRGGAGVSLSMAVQSSY